MEINKAELEARRERLGQVISELDDLAHRIEQLGDQESLEDAVFLDRISVGALHERTSVKTETVLALLVHAGETAEAAEHLRQEAERLRTAVLALYR